MRDERFDVPTIAAFLSGAPVSAELVRQVDPDVDLTRAFAELSWMGYPTVE